ncbi:histidine kinase-like ATPase [Infundibulicybe gibba]|nr:histidine kinase-like ATPase [Infundibulicybe gibba]
MSVESVIKPIDTASIHKITSGQVVIDLQTAVKELVENSIDAGATNIEVRFKHHGVKGVEVIDNGCGIAEKDHDSIALKHHTSKLASFSDLTVVRTFGFRGEALSSLCNLCDSVVVTTSTSPPLGVSLEFDRHGRVQKRSKIARQRGTTVSLTDIFSSLPVRRKELERNAKREFGKALALLNAYALGPCCSNKGVRLTVSNQMEKGYELPKTIQLRTPGSDSNRASVTALWGPKAIEHIVDLDLKFNVERDKLVLKRLNHPCHVKGLVSKFSLGCGRTGTDRQFFYVNGRPCNLSKVQKAFNEVYRTFNATQAPFILADFIIPTDSCDINISPDKRTIFIHSEGNLISALKVGECLDTILRLTLISRRRPLKRHLSRCGRHMLLVGIRRKLQRPQGHRVCFQERLHQPPQLPQKIPQRHRSPGIQMAVLRQVLELQPARYRIIF